MISVQLKCVCVYVIVKVCRYLKKAMYYASFESVAFSERFV